MVTFSEDGIGDKCENGNNEKNYDGDALEDDIDVCPRNNKIDRTDFVVLQKVLLYREKKPVWRDEKKPVWRVRPNGLEVVQEKLSRSAIAVGKLFCNVTDLLTERFLICGVTQVDTDSQMLTSMAHFLRTPLTMVATLELCSVTKAISNSMLQCGKERKKCNQENLLPSQAFISRQIFLIEQLCL